MFWLTTLSHWLIEWFKPASPSPQRLKEKMPTYYLQELFTVEDYELVVLECKKKMVYHTGQQPKRYIPVILILVEYLNRGDSQPVRFTPLQWLLYDQKGYVYEPQMGFCREDIPLKGGLVNPGQRVKGWVAFVPAEGAELDYVQFRKDYSTSWVIDVKLQPIPPC